MKSILNPVILILITVIILFDSCKKEYSCEGCYGSNSNKSPIANAGPYQTIVLPIDSVLMDGSGSSDPDGTITQYKWSKIAGPVSANISKPDSSRTMVKTLTTGIYKFELTVKDNGGLSAKDTVQIIVNDPSQPNRPPVANAGADQTIILPTNTVNLNGSGSNDPDNNITNYAWTKISGPTSFNIVNSNAVQTQATTLVQGIYQFELKVTDAGALFSKDTVQVTVNASPPPPADVCGPTNRPIINAQLVPFGILSEGSGSVAVASAGNKILFAGGWGSGPLSPIGGEATARVDIYDLVTHSWSTAQLSVARWAIAVAVSGNKIFFAGGVDSDEFSFSIYYKNIDIYDASTDSWSVDSLRFPGLYTAAAVGNKVLFAGDNNASSQTLNVNDVDIYNLTTNSWSVATFGERRSGMLAVSVNDKTYFAGGYHLTTASNRIDIYDNATGSWSVSTLIEPKSALAGIAVGNNIYWAGGYNSVVESRQVEIKDIIAQTSSIDCLFQPNTGFVAVLKNNKIVFFTGDGAMKNKFDIYDITTSTWSIGVLNENISGASIISVNNTIYVAGGNVNNSIFNGVWKLEF